MSGEFLSCTSCSVNRDKLPRSCCSLRLDCGLVFVIIYQLSSVFIFLQLKVGFCLSNELVRKVNEIPIDQEQEEGTLLTTTEDGGRILIFKQDLTVQFSNNSTQVQ